VAGGLLSYGINLPDIYRRLGGNVTGFAMFEFSMGGKWLDLLKKLVPSTKRIAVLFNPPTPAAPFAKLYFQSIAAAAPHFGIEPFSMEIDDEADVKRRLSDLAREPNSGLIVQLVRSARARARVMGC
jgi:putative ABC transport system substrate-binding protein